MAACCECNTLQPSVVFNALLSLALLDPRGPPGGNGAQVETLQTFPGPEKSQQKPGSSHAFAHPQEYPWSGLAGCQRPQLPVLWSIHAQGKKLKQFPGLWELWHGTSLSASRGPSPGMVEAEKRNCETPNLLSPAGRSPKS